ncbi:hypothetical protein L1887_14583 [Cichorium endivia]|nr:hypothetical protein L1887_14583 [Cichorium endivia]
MAERLGINSDAGKVENLMRRFQAKVKRIRDNFVITILISIRSTATVIHVTSNFPPLFSSFSDDEDIGGRRDIEIGRGIAALFESKKRKRLSLPKDAKQKVIDVSSNSKSSLVSKSKVDVSSSSKGDSSVKVLKVKKVKDKKKGKKKKEDDDFVSAPDFGDFDKNDNVNEDWMDSGPSVPRFDIILDGSKSIEVQEQLEFFMKNKENPKDAGVDPNQVKYLKAMQK